MGLLNIIRRMHLREKLSIREIARRTVLSRNTVTKHLAAETVEPKFATPGPAARAYAGPRRRGLRRRRRGSGAGRPGAGRPRRCRPGQARVAPQCADRQGTAAAPGGGGTPPDAAAATVDEADAEAAGAAELGTGGLRPVDGPDAGVMPPSGWPSRTCCQAPSGPASGSGMMASMTSAMT